ncbi:hypothetical protein [Allostreptomyces psammosilenae]|uniref:Uncharacterized protein n=1 Tax=Allostreptomyces psammosilenae TaxID=1892865 RepID=A0A853A547_9ACTN|nr:hypothetical protein [Allostreptomyces psammosilenae]NYI05821.1 hypothetical protein [Allostreptomyces psammosilenae]
MRMTTIVESVLRRVAGRAGTGRAAMGAGRRTARRSVAGRFYGGGAGHRTRRPAARPMRPYARRTSATHGASGMIRSIRRALHR